MCASPWSQPFTVPGPLSGQSCSRAASLHHLHLALDRHPSANSGVVRAAPACPSPWQGGSLLLRKGLHRWCCSTRTASLQTRLCWQHLRPQPCTGKEMGRKAGSSLCWSHRAGGPPYQPWLQGSPPHREYLHTAAHRALGVMLTTQAAANRASPSCPQWGVEKGGHEAPVHQPPMQPHVQQWVLPSQGCLLGTGSHRAVSPKGCWC